MNSPLESPANRLKQARINAGYPSARSFAEKHGLNVATYSNHEAGRRGLKEHALKQYAQLLGIAPEFLMFGGAPIAFGAKRAENEEIGDLPVYASAQGGPGQVLLFDSEPIEHAVRPSVLQGVRDGYGVILSGDSMEPAYRNSDTIYINPHLAISPGMDVLLIRFDRKVGNKLALVKHLLFKTNDKLHLRQYNPPPGQETDFTLDADEVETIAAVVGMSRSY
ncbi:MAG: S24 family peptidase [Alphaproteobacteria bacterium]